MTISVKCKTCGKKLKAPDSAAGKKAKCPGCGKVVKIPEPVYDAEEVDDGVDDAVEDYEDYEDYGAADDSESYGFDGADEYSAPAMEQRRPCPMCGEMIVAKAAKCRFCGEILDPALKRKKKKRSRSRSRTQSYSNDGELTGVDWILCLFCGGIACIVGLVALCTGDSARGTKMIFISIGMGILWRVIFATIVAMQRGL